MQEAKSNIECFYPIKQSACASGIVDFKRGKKSCCTEEIEIRVEKSGNT